LSFKCISKNDALKIINQDKCIIIDIRDLKSFNEGHIDGAIHLMSENINNFIISTNKKMNIIIYCYHGNSSKNVAKYLFDEGFRNIFSLDGGYEIWKNNIN